MAIKELEESYIPFQCMIVSDTNRFNVEGVSTAQYYILDTLNKQGPKTTKELAEDEGYFAIWHFQTDETFVRKKVHHSREAQ